MNDDDLSVEELVHERRLPDKSWDDNWSRIYVDTQDKEKLVNYGLLVRQFDQENLDQMTLSHHGVILLTGPPGTGKTSLSKGAANELAKRIDGDVVFKRIEVQHLFSGSLGDTPKLVENAFQQVIEPARNPANDTYQVLLLDEVESLFSSRSMLSGDTDPMDAVRAVNTALEAIDELSNLPGVYVIATSNQPRAIDRAYFDRTDDQIFLGNPKAKHRESILLDIFAELNDSLNASLPTEPAAVTEAVELSSGFSGRRIRKTVLAALSRNEATVRDPSTLTYDQVLDEIDRTYRLIREKGSSDYINLGDTPDEAIPDASPLSEETEVADEGQRTSGEESPTDPTSNDKQLETATHREDDDTSADPNDGDAEAAEQDAEPDPPSDTDQPEHTEVTYPQEETESTTDAEQTQPGPGADDPDATAPEEWLDRRVAVFDTIKSAPAEALRDDIVTYFIDTLVESGIDSTDQIEALMNSEEVLEVLDHLSMRRKLSAVSLIVDEFRTTVEITTDRSATADLAVAAEDALPTFDGNESLTVTFHVDSGVDIEPPETKHENTNVVISHE